MAKKSRATTPATQVRQGDLLFIRRDALPAGVPLTQRASQVILEGETTGHAHRLVGGAILDATDASGLTWIEIPMSAQSGQVVHEEHNTVTLDPGVWVVVRQREFHPEAIRLVVD